MPTYTFRDKQTDDVVELQMRISELDVFKEQNPHLEQTIGSPNVVRHKDLKPDSGWRDVLKGIKKASGRTNTINTF